MMSVSALRLGVLGGLTALYVASFAQADLPPQDSSLADVKAARTQRLLPHSTPPAIDWPRIKNAYAFFEAHKKSIHTTFITSSTITPLASQDILPILLADGKITSDFRRQTKITSDWIDKMMATPGQSEDFVNKNYKAARDFGLMNLDLSQAVKIKWNPKNRVPGNQQAFALVLYAYGWQPIESMIESKAVDPAKDGKAIEDWLYLWNVLGYAMGEDQRLLPRSAKQSANTIRLVRAFQYPGPGQEISRRLREILRSEMEYLYFLEDSGRPIDDPTKLELRKILAREITASPGLSKALGLGDDPLKALEILTNTID